MKRYHATIKANSRSIGALRTVTMNAHSIGEAHYLLDKWIIRPYFYNSNRQPYVRIINLS